MSEAAARNAQRLADASRVVVKIGSSLLVDAASGHLNQDWLGSLAQGIVRMRARGQQVILVSSGAIALGRPYLGMKRTQRLLEENQAAAAAGQVVLAHAYQEIFAPFDSKIAQVLLTPDDTESRRRYLNARNTLETLLSLEVIPVINENDTVATQEIRYGDNDRLAARVAEMVSADVLVLLSDVSGLYSADPGTLPDSDFIPEVTAITAEIEAMAGSARTEFGSGGMATKVAAARMCMSAGCATVISLGNVMQPLERIEQGEPCTWFLPSSTPLAARKQWIAGTLTPAGVLTVDPGAEKALLSGGSLLSVGVVNVSGHFERGDAVIVKSSAGRDLAHGLVAYDSQETAALLGRQSEEFEAALGYRGRNELVHRDNLVLLVEK
ncbi:MAG: glutamate 5-kinase [Gammaproteobacteria bacterium]|nr:glutamate 5-kinase [Gammaproteobacteria bacterium]